ncbi:MAG: exodeoxyribonuclease V subunit alpha [Desulfamplus sp.]|nr:exodeoxyribonuclease V subunit alpha [Desulfamplus sp.]
MADIQKESKDEIFDKIFSDPIFSDIDREFALFISAIDNTPEALLAALLVSYATTTSGDVCLYLPLFRDKALKDVIADATSDIVLPQLDRWIEILENSRAVGKPDQFFPMILDSKGRLYLQRYWYYEDMLAKNIKLRIESNLNKSQTLNKDISEILNTFFPSKNSDLFEEPDLQRVAAEVAILKNFAVISGGPGTGKTTTIAKILIALSILELKRGKKLLTAVTAPTGKAAARLMESINSAIAKFEIDESTTAILKQSIPTEAYTIHRLLGYRQGSSFFKHNRDNLLAYDLVIVDESSMADLPLMAKLFDALSLKSKIILLGDSNQLSSVESGAVLGDICSSSNNDINVNRLDKAPLIAESIVHLKKSFRFDKSSGIGALSNFVNRGRVNDAINLLLSGKYSDVRFIEPKSSPTNPSLSLQERSNINFDLIDSIAVSEYKKFLEVTDPNEAFNLLTQFRILTPIRKGQGGVESINRYIDTILSRDVYGIRGKAGNFYNSLPIIVKKNDYSMSLYNGDIGIFLQEKDGLRVFFQGQKGFRKFMPGRLPEHEIAYSLTVHKSQGSEFDRVLLVIPESKSPVLTREMLYTAITRAKKEVTILASTGSIARMIENPIRRYSGLSEALWDR